MLKRTHVLAFAIACVPVLLLRPAVAQEKSRPDRVYARDLSRDGDGLRSAALARRRPDHLHARLDRQDERQARIRAVDHERRRQPQPVPGQGIRARGGRRPATASPTRRPASRRARRSSSAGWMPKGATSQVTRVDQSPSAVAWSPDGNQLSFTMLVEDRNELADQDAQGAERREVDRDAAHRRAPELPARSHRLRGQRLPAPLRRSGNRRHAAADHRGQPRRHWHRMDAGRPEHPLQRAAQRERRVPVARVGDLRRRRRERRGQAADHAQGAGLESRRVSPDGKRVAYTGYDWTRDTWVDSKIYVMNIDGSNSAPRVRRLGPRASRDQVVGRRQQRCYFTAQNEGAQNLYNFRSPGPTPARSSRSRRARTC